MPADPEYRQLLIEAFDGERMGVALGRELAAVTPEARLRAVYHAFEEVETVARAQLEPMVSAAGAGDDALSDEAADQQGVGLAREMAAQPVAVAWTQILPELERFVGLLERLRALAPPADSRACDVLVDHEEASVEMVRALVDDDLDLAETRLREFLGSV